MMDTSVRSEVADSRQIISFVVVAYDVDPWVPEEGTGKHRRTGRLTIRIKAVLKGSLQQQPEEELTLTISQRANPDGSVRGYYGLWSNAPTAVGTHLTAFCDGEAEDARLALTDEHCDPLVRTDSVERDLRIALALERRTASPDEVLAEAARVRGDAGALFGRYVWVLTHDRLAESPDAFARLMAIIEDPTTTREGRECYLTAAYEDATFTEAFSVGQEARLARAMFRAALDPGIGELRRHVLGTYLPNLVGVKPAERLSLDHVFATEPTLLAEVREEVERSPDAFAEPLRAWLTAEDRS